MDVQEVLSHAREAMSVKRVFGDPYEKDGVTVIPVAAVMGGAGGGGGTGGAQADDANDEAAENAADSGYGMGYGLRAAPAGVYVIKDGEVEWKPALDPQRLTMQVAAVTVVALLVLRSIVKTLAKR
jgi:uncharacterized spore protein YtfJ